MRWSRIILTVALAVIFAMNAYGAETIDSVAVRRPFDNLYPLILNYMGDMQELDEENSEDLYDELYDIYLNPININGTTREELERIPFLTDSDIEELLYYTEQLGQMHSTKELLMVENLDRALLILLPEFITTDLVRCDDRKWSDAFRYMRHRVTARVDYTPELRRGFKHRESDSVRAYRGANFRAYTKYQFSACDDFRFGVALEQDYGEPFVGKGAQGFDLYRLYIEGRNLGVVRRAVAGAYRVGFGQGLLFSQPRYGDAMSRLFTTSPSAQIRGYAGVAEQPVLLGVAMNVARKFLNVIILYGAQLLDADTTGGVWSSYSTTGYHRTEGELARRNNLQLHTVGAHADFKIKRFRVGVTGYGGFFSLPAVLSSSAPDGYGFVGKYQWGVAVDYGYRSRRVNFVGETSLVQQCAVATTNTLSLNLLSDVEMALNYRYFSPNYHSFWASTFSARSKVNGEHGASFAMKFPVVRGLRLSFLASAYKTLVATNLRPAMTTGYEVRGDLYYLPRQTQNLRLYARYRLSPEWQEVDGQLTKWQVAVPRLDFYLRYVWRVGVMEYGSCVQANVVSESDRAFRNPRAGWFVAQDVAYKPESIPFTLRARMACYGAPTYASRFFCNEADVPESGYSPAYYGEALRWYLVASYKFDFGMTVAVKAAQTLYADRNQIGSGNDQIDAWHRTDLRLYLRWDVKQVKGKK